MKWLLLLSCLSLGLTSSAQKEELSFEEQLAQLEMEMDSISLFGFLDSLLNSTEFKSEMGIRVGYSSSRLTAGRDFNLEQKGISPGISYYHKSGAYADFSSFFDNQSTPALNQSILHLGYLWIPNKNWIITPYVEKTFNHQDYNYDLTQGLGTNFNYDFKLAEVSLDYSFLWGKSTGHRVFTNVSKRIDLNNIPLIKKISLYPTISAVTGTTDIFNYLYSSSQVDNYLLKVQFLTDDEIRRLRLSGKITTEEAIELRIARHLLNNGTEEDREYLISLLNTLEEDNIFALLSYSFSLPLSFQLGPKTSVMLSYSYSIPVKLPGEDLGVDSTGFFSFSLSRRITW